MANDDDGNMYDGESFSNAAFGNNDDAVGEIIDAIASNNHRRTSLENADKDTGGVYSYYNLEDVIGNGGKIGNNWAGANHWKKGKKPSGGEICRRRNEACPDLSTDAHAFLSI